MIGSPSHTFLNALIPIKAVPSIHKEILRFLKSNSFRNLGSVITLVSASGVYEPVFNSSAFEITNAANHIGRYVIHIRYAATTAPSQTEGERTSVGRPCIVPGYMSRKIHKYFRFSLLMYPVSVPPTFAGAAISTAGGSEHWHAYC